MLNNRLRLLPLLLATLLAGSPLLTSAQIKMPGVGGSTGADATREYLIGGITVTGAQYLDADLLTTISGLSTGTKVRMPGDPAFSRAIRNLWRQELFSDVQILVDKYVGDRIFLTIAVEERPRLSKQGFRGIRKSEAEELQKRTGLVTSRVLTDGMKKDATVRIQRYYNEKGYGNVSVQPIERPDPDLKNSVSLTFVIDKGTKTRINHINIAGNEEVSDAKLKGGFRNTTEMARITLYPADQSNVYETDERSVGHYFKTLGFLSPSRTLDVLDPYFRYKFWKGSKFNPEKFEQDKESILTAYNSLGYRDAKIIDDTVYSLPNGNMNIELKVDEGRKYYFGDFTWKGNTKYSTEQLSEILGIRRGDVYNQELLDKRLGRMPSMDGSPEVTSLYMDDGYLFFQIEAVERSIVGDTINYEVRITEGTQATIKDIRIAGNDRTNEHVIRREIRTVPGSKFSRADLIRSQREIGALGFFDPEKIDISPKPNPEDGTVDIDYRVVEKSSDQLQLSLGFGGGLRFYGNIGVQFNNFSLRNVLRPRLWDPLPVGDGQKFSVNFQGNLSFNSLNVSFTEPWLGGKKPTALTTTFLYSRISRFAQMPDSAYLKVVGGNVSISRRLKWPDDNFVLTTGLNYQRYTLSNYTGFLEGFGDGKSNNLNLQLRLARYSVDQPLYPRSGSDINFTFQFTPPYSAFSSRDPATMSLQEKFRFIEYHKYRLNANWYQRITGNLVLKLGAKYGFLGYYNPAIGYSPFERFQVGGDGLNGAQNFFIGRDIVAHRGYEVYAQNATVFNKYQAEVRYPFSLSPTSTIYGLAFFDMANAWNDIKGYNPFKLNRSAGVGVRLFLPMFGLLGLDYGVGFDRYDPASGNTRLKDLGRFNFMLGFEPE